jgi:hypothetical protein
MHISKINIDHCQYFSFVSIGVCVAVHVGVVGKMYALFFENCA